jgi:hypothetical protein
MGRKRIEKTTELWSDTKGFLRFVFVENEYDMEGESHLYFKVGGRGMLINVTILADEFIGFLDQWAEFKKTVFKKAGIEKNSSKLVT